MRISDYNDGRIRISIFSGELIDERTYVISGGEGAIVIDPHEEDGLISYLRGENKIAVFLTHEHYDHISGVNLLKKFFACTVYASDICGGIIMDSDNATGRFPLLLIGNKEKYHWAKTHLKLPYVCTADILIKDRMSLALFDHQIALWKSPGHSPGGMSILVDNKYLFSGDNLLGNGMELKSIGSNSDKYIKTLKEYRRLSHESIVVFPGHGESDLLENYLDKLKGIYKWN